MAKQINVSVGGVVKKVKEVPLGIGGVVKKAKSGKCGVGGVVKTFYDSALVLYDNGVTDYTWSNANNNGTYLSVDGHQTKIGSAIDLSPYTKCYVTFQDCGYVGGQDSDNAAWPYGIVYIYVAGITNSDKHHEGWTRKANAMFTLSIDISDIAGKMTNVQPRLDFSLFKSNWIENSDFNYVNIYKIWFE